MNKKYDGKINIFHIAILSFCLFKITRIRPDLPREQNRNSACPYMPLFGDQRRRG
jgi:hypothetical protein